MPKGDGMVPDTAMVTAGGVAARGGREVERLRRQVEVMLAYALDKGLTPAPQAWMFDAVRDQATIDLGTDGWATPLPDTPEPRTSTGALVRAHRELSRLVSPARPASLELLQAYREGRRPGPTPPRIPRQQPRPAAGASAGSGAAPGPGRLRLRRPRLPGVGSSVPLVRSLIVATVVFLALFVAFAASPDSRHAITEGGVGVVVDTGPGSSPGDDGSGGDDREGGRQLQVSDAAGLATGPAFLSAADDGPSFPQLLLRELFLLCAAGLGACLTALYRASREVARGTYDPEFDHTFVQRVVLGMACGLILAELLPAGAGTSPMVLPAVAVVGGFAASVVHRILSRLVAALEALFSGDAEEQEDHRRELAQKRADEVLAQAERANLATLLEIRRIAASGAPTRAVIDEIDRMIVQMSPS